MIGIRYGAVLLVLGATTSMVAAEPLRLADRELDRVTAAGFAVDVHLTFTRSGSEPFGSETWRYDAVSLWQAVAERLKTLPRPGDGHSVGRTIELARDAGVAVGRATGDGPIESSIGLTLMDRLADVRALAPGGSVSRTVTVVAPDGGTTTATATASGPGELSIRVVSGPGVAQSIASSTSPAR